MCGIHAAITTATHCPISKALERRLRNRGPDHLGTITTRLRSDDDESNAFTLSLTSTVLSLRGDHVARQPLVHGASGSVLCWNGEAWKIRSQAVRGNDAEAVLTLLSETGRSSPDDNGKHVLDSIREIEGPFAFIYFDRPANRLYYGRDRLGRRSLLVKPGEPFLLASISDCSAPGWTEVEADGIYSLQFNDASTPNDLSPIVHSWVEDESLISGIGTFNDAIPKEAFHLTQNSEVIGQLRQHLIESLRLRVLQVPVPPGASPSDARVAVLFSGGLDCTVLARLASDLLPSEQTIDLLNVAFENPRIAAQNKGVPQDELFELCPDRVTGRKSFAELLSACPERSWRLVTINVPFSETSDHRSEVIDLIYPHNTEMDLSIAYALYFAARGVGLYQSNIHDPPQPYKTTARVLLSGLGADEIFGGYMRHATAYSRRGYAGLVEELKLDVGRLGKRNLGRDDRAMAHWSREVRFPYLDEEFVKWAIELPIWLKCDFENGESDGVVEPGKRVLRLLAAELGMDAVSREKKRAIQFGARTAKMESGKVKGTTFLSP